jgi:hypothetical protein
VQLQSLYLSVLTIIIPIPFFILDAYYNSFQRGCLERFTAIRTFIREQEYKLPGKNIQRLDEFLATGETMFPIPDHHGKYTIEEKKYKKITSWRKNAFTEKMGIFYGSLVILSILTICTILWSPIDFNHSKGSTASQKTAHIRTDSTGGR